MLASAQQTGLLTALEGTLSGLACEKPSRLASLSRSSRSQLSLTLLFLGAVGLHRTWDLRSYTGDALGLLTARKHAYGYFHTERFLADVAKSNGAERLTNILAQWTTDLWQSEALVDEDQRALFYIDGHRKPVYADTLIPRGLVGRLSTVLGCRALVLLHDAHGHPLLVTTHRGINT